MHQEYKDRGLVVVGINSGGLLGPESAETVERFIEQTGVTFDVGFDFNRSLTQFRSGDRISPLPIDAIIDTDGTVAYLSYAFDAEEMRAAIERLVDPLPTPPEGAE